MIGERTDRPDVPVTLSNWQAPDQVSWTFRHMSQLFPSAVIARGEGPAPQVPAHPQPLGDVRLPDGRTVSDVLSSTETAGWMVLHGGRVLAEHYDTGMGPASPHLLMSVSKTVVGLLVGALVDRGVLHPQTLVADVVPELRLSGYSGATVRHLLDMRSGIRFSEDYLDPTAEVRVLEQAFGWAPRLSDDVPYTLRGFLAGLTAKSAHGGPFEYRSCETDILGWVCEAVTGQRFPELVSQLVWAPMGAQFDASVGVDIEGSSMFDGGISATLGDLARMGLVLLQDGVSVSGQQVVSASWVHDTVIGDPDSRDAFAASPGDNRMPGGAYRNQVWVPRPGLLLCLGIHGQMVYVNRSTGLVAAKLSAWPYPQDAWRLFSTVDAFDAIGAHLQP
ncbi:hypothetical protein SAMN06264364_10584 [Quadrisphaera granulorum]|uniref:Beta-lactamase-related domain-containing protein n=1 Tax=Quadrisphaera granulorum TaxID=317664 RepID=A0A316AXE9_9ACTN|nr:hypothetical protein BXY45_10584 [Quadrisphaera granulorum]SZE95823.1 hypothetical protein SAMN06264364_10584 [Quadrisphaera granulorum]